ncbi:diguanylate cyclase domain-containing protein [Parahaliea aestuarii]|uniref:Sensor domain-containing diguanylate cyclase n=1 Tax=Parahaliea aestuarii TaxID=1852021 RepID=A0A5C8ZR66_9GAMM|nr:diguanylate cyclase [Parahaliea aestuarii]TXS90996.1 sensor domain-containing diguanylate cyclase [Parahaliea aestuarii]
MATALTKRNKAAIGLGILALIGFGIYAEESFVRLFRERAIDLEREQAHQAIALARARLEAEMLRNTYLSDSLASFITMDPELSENRWKTVAEKLFEKSTTLRSVGIAPGDVISQIYPIEGNEKALGLDFRTVPEQMRSIQRARESEDVYIAGPVQLVQGGDALIARFPIFRDFPYNQNYWGSVSVVMGFQSIVEASGLAAIEGASVALRRADIESGEPVLIYGDESVFAAPDIELPVNTPSDVWQLAARYHDSDTPGLRGAVAFIRGIALAVTALIITSILLLFRAYRLSRNAALIDELTHIPNRRFVMAHLHRLISGGSRPAHFTLLLIDLNRFKEVNDNLGHEAGDALLVHVSRHLQQAVRTADIVARLGGDEFIVILHRVSEKPQAEAIVEKIRAHMHSSTLFWHGEKIQPSVSIGYALCYGQDTSVKELLARADEMMYRSKRERLEVISSWR